MICILSPVLSILGGGGPHLRCRKSGIKLTVAVHLTPREQHDIEFQNSQENMAIYPHHIPLIYLTKSAREHVGDNWVHWGDNKVSQSARQSARSHSNCTASHQQHLRTKHKLLQYWFGYACHSPQSLPWY